MAIGKRKVKCSNCKEVYYLPQAEAKPIYKLYKIKTRVGKRLKILYVIDTDEGSAARTLVLQKSGLANKMDTPIIETEEVKMDSRRVL